MKKIFLLLTVLFLITQYTATAQKSGVITYEMTVNVHAALSGFEKVLKVFIPEEKTSKVKVTFNENYAKVETVKEESEGMIMMRMDNEDTPLYLNLKNQKRIKLLEFEETYYGTKIPMEVSLEKLIKGKTKQILNYDCVAYEKDDEVKVMTKVTSNSKNETSENKDDKGLKSTIWIAQGLPKGLSPMGEVFWTGTLMSFESELIKYEAIDISFESVTDETVMPEVEFKEISEEQMSDLQEEILNQF